MKKYKSQDDSITFMESKNKGYKKKRKSHYINYIIFIAFLFLFLLFMIFIIIGYIKKNNEKNLLNLINIKKFINVINNSFKKNNITLENTDFNNDTKISLTENIKTYNLTNKLSDIIYSKKELDYYSISNILDRTKEFVNKSADGILLNNNSFYLSHNPKISVVIPIYNCPKTIKRAIRSIQNQNFSDFEIILVNDLSTDNTSIIIENLKKEDPRIKIINNKKNMGTLYTRCIGSLSSKGKYIFPLDNDDMFIENDIFSKIAIEIAEKNDFDIVEFRAIETRGLKNFFLNKITPTLFSHHRKGRVLYQPELSDYPIRPSKELNKYHMSDVYIWGKCINSQIYKKAIEI